VKPTERLLDLLILLLNAKRPLALDEIREAFPGEYDDESGRRKFERDKDELKQLGIPLRFVEEDDDEDESGYLVERDEAWLPELALEADERAVVYLAGLSLLDKSAFPYRDALASALRKIDGALPSLERVVIDAGERDVAPVEDSLRALEGAIAARKRVRFTYRAQYNDATAAREVEPYGLFRRRGRWSLVGFARERSSIRVFLVHRMRDVTVDKGAPDFEVPGDFRLADWAQLPAWRYEIAPPLTLELELRADHAFVAERELGVAASGDGEWRTVRIETTNPDALVRFVLGLGPAARIVAPAELRAQVKAQLAKVAR
jgi:proteasome accessory factor B